MSFANQVRNELARLDPDRDCCFRAETAGFIVAHGSCKKMGENQYSLSITSENAATARKIFKLVKQCYQVPTTVRAQEHRRFNKSKIFIVDTLIGSEEILLLQQSQISFRKDDVIPVVPWKIIRKNCCRRAYLRAIFLARGFINHPQGTYHLELNLHDRDWALELQKLIKRMRIEARLGERKNKPILYIKDSEGIVDFLRVVGASKNLLDFENVRVFKSVRNSVNRQVNCETANLVKTIDASLRQVNLIQGVIEKLTLTGIPDPYRELALLRMQYPEHSLQELGNLMQPPLSKSTVAYRMKKLEKIAREMVE